MNLVLFLTGLVLLLLVISDLLYTAFSSRGGGFITTFTTKQAWKFILILSKYLRLPQLLNYAGLLIICLTLLQWVVLVWGANLLIVASDDFSILHAQTKLPAGLTEKIYVVGYTLTTMGNGDFIGGSPALDVYLSLASFTGIAALTVAFTYQMQVLSGVISKRAFSSSVFSLGSDPEQLLSNAWNGKDLSSLNHHLPHLGNQITMLAEKHMAYPILHYYSIQNRNKSLPVALSLLDEVMTIIYTSIPQQYWPNHLIMQSTRYSVSGFLDTLKGNFINPADSTPSLPELSHLERKKIPMEEVERYKLKYEEQSERRKILLGLLQNDGQEWNVVYSRKNTKAAD